MKYIKIIFKKLVTFKKVIFSLKVVFSCCFVEIIDFT